jgi:hypothetical protein
MGRFYSPAGAARTCVKRHFKSMLGVFHRPDNGFPAVAIACRKILSRYLEPRYPAAQTFVASIHSSSPLQLESLKALLACTKNSSN